MFLRESDSGTDIGKGSQTGTFWSHHNPRPGSFKSRIGRVVQNVFSEMDAMLDQDFFANSDKILSDLLDLANNELNSAGVKVEPSVIVARIISPLKDLYLRSLAELIESSLRKNP